MVDTALSKETEKLKVKLETAKVPADLKTKALEMIERLSLMGQFQGYSTEYERVSQYLSWITSLPWEKLTQDRLELTQARQILDKHHYGMDEVKDRILEYLATMSLTRGKEEAGRAPILCLVGLVGTGKTTFGPSLAEALNRAYVRIPFGGLGSALDLRGQSRLHPDAEPGLVIKALKRAKSRNPVMLLDEIDRVTVEARADIMGVLVELLDPEQNAQFTDHYLDFPFDLSQVLFLATANNTRNVATAVLDRLEVIQMPSYTDEEKIAIAKEYMLPKIIKESGLSAENLQIDENIWPKIVRPLGFDSGIRTLERTIEGVAGKIAREIVSGKAKQFHLTLDNIKQYLPNY
ncbi:AAA family ATPase [Patescibacteria group bacterium]|nr:AAA family ATPase [Patescibacteria group bacterium]